VLHAPPLKKPPAGAHCVHAVADEQLAQPGAHAVHVPSAALAKVPLGQAPTQLPPLRKRPAAQALQSVLVVPVQLLQVKKHAWHAPEASTYVPAPQLVTQVVPFR